ncbi:MAG: hypothetical protein ABS92_02820 [Thiobacillus sp. SCN 63-374]|nr:MAG: hypothetical protein ABS92_02820 [Thiobacillus sp. SCN 63-374]
MKTTFVGLLLSLSLLGVGNAWAADSLNISLVPDQANSPSPQMGDWLKFHSVVSNPGTQSAHGIVAWISLVQVDPGQEQPVDLEDWSAHKAVTQAVLQPGQQVKVEWPMRLIQAGTYRVVISAVDRETGHVMTSPFVDFQVRRKPVVESLRILPVAFGIPTLLLGVVGWRRYRSRAG